MKKKISGLLVVLFLISVMGCATTKEFESVQGDLARETKALKEENASLRKDVEKINQAISGLGKNQAEMGADITDIRDEIQKLKGTVEGLRKDISLFKEYREKVDNVNFKISFIENFLGVGSQGRPDPDKKGKAQQSPLKGVMDKEALYQAATETFKEGKYDKAIIDFNNFLKQYPDTEYSDSAQYWIGESYYFKKEYEKAILEYEKVVKNYPKGNKVPYALVKQGLSFLMLGDKTSAGLIFQQVIKDYPDTNQARIARAKLIEMQ